MDKENILFLDFDDVLNSTRSFYKKFAEHHGVEWSEDDFSEEYWGQGNIDEINPILEEKIKDEWNKQKELSSYIVPDLSFENYPHDEFAIVNLNKIVEENNAKVVICSSWRNDRSIKDLQKILDEWGAKCQVIGKTITSRRDRGFEILDWVIKYRDQIKGICILDDSSPMDISYIFKKWCVMGISGYHHGLRDIHIPEAKKCFETPFNLSKDFGEWIPKGALHHTNKKFFTLENN